MTEKGLQTDRQTDIVTEKAKTIYPLYTSYGGYNEYVLRYNLIDLFSIFSLVFYCFHHEYVSIFCTSDDWNKIPCLSLIFDAKINCEIHDL